MSEVSSGSTPIEPRFTVPQHTPMRAAGVAQTHAGQRPDETPAGSAALATSTGFLALRAALRQTGGAARGDDLARLLADSQRGGFVSLARLIVRNEVFGFSWRQTWWIPMFQFDLHDLTLRRAPQQVRQHLPADFDGWALASWFARPNRWLEGHPPLALLASNLPVVVDAARACRSDSCD